MRSGRASSGVMGCDDISSWGRASPTTLILLKRAADADEPRLSAITP